jgi:dTDP-4-dehydrorhamnose 3,5-epimerase
VFLGDPAPQKGRKVLEALSIPGAWVFTPQVHHDSRGYFLEYYRAEEFTTDLGYPLELGQANCSNSHQSVIRGVHFSAVPPGQAKYVACASGSVHDVIVDVREGSPTFGRFESVLLDDVRRRTVFLEHGLGHAFMALSEAATLMYMCSTPYDPTTEKSVHPLDPSLGITWPGDPAQYVLSAKDAAAPTLAEASRTGLLPSYLDCLQHTRRLIAYGGQATDGIATRGPEAPG